MFEGTLQPSNRRTVGAAFEVPPGGRERKSRGGGGGARRRGQQGRPRGLWFRGEMHDVRRRTRPRSALLHHLRDRGARHGRREYALARNRRNTAGPLATLPSIAHVGSAATHRHGACRTAGSPATVQPCDRATWRGTTAGRRPRRPVPRSSVSAAVCWRRRRRATAVPRAAPRTQTHCILPDRGRCNRRCRARSRSTWW